MLIPLVTDNPQLTLLLFSLFTVLHLVSNFKAVRSVVMETFNEARLDVVWQNFVRNGEILPLQEANGREPVFNWFSGTVPIRLGVKLQELVDCPEDLERLTQKRKKKQFLIGVRNGCVCVCLLFGASLTDEFEAMCQALSLRKLLKKNPRTSFIVSLHVWSEAVVELVQELLIYTDGYKH
ncbi:hypothetical protein WMY93_025168 [Mugilogobius chulae]|uniref:Uncharacterized protein n=1 Tax=Mugilogobius chulae TaxID=88201 RepID=A0AAW0N3C1_9GOBI